MTDGDKWWDSFCVFWRDFGWSISADARSNLEKTETGVDVPHGVVENAERLIGDGRRFISYTEKIGEIDTGRSTGMYVDRKTLIAIVKRASEENKT